MSGPTTQPNEAQALATITSEKARLAIVLAQKQLDAEADAKPEALALVVVESAEDYETVTEIRGMVRTAKDEAVALRQAAAKPWKGVATAIEEMFRPYIKALETIEGNYRGKLEAYQVAREAERRALEVQALAAAQADDSDTLTTALTQSAALVANGPAGGAVKKTWTVERVNADLLPDEWWTPDRAKIDAVAKAHKGDDPPVIPGVVFKQAISVAVSRSSK